MRSSKYNQKINIVWQFLLAEEIVSVQEKKMALGGIIINLISVLLSICGDSVIETGLLW